MKILGIGVDIVENSRITKLLKNMHFIKRIFSNSEILIAKKVIFHICDHFYHLKVCKKKKKN